MSAPIRSRALLQCIPPKERATAVSLTTSGMYMGSAAAIQFLPALATRYGAGVLTRLNGVMGLAWLSMWLVVSRSIPGSRCLLSAARTRVYYTAPEAWLICFVCALLQLPGNAGHVQQNAESTHCHSLGPLDATPGRVGHRGMVSHIVLRFFMLPVQSRSKGRSSPVEHKANA